VLLRSEEARSSEFVTRAAEILKRNALAQSRLVRDLLDLSRLQVGKLSLNQEVVSLTTIIDNAVETVRGEAAIKQIEIKVDSAEDVVFVNADPLRLEQVIWNLLNNAVKFTPAGGAVSIRVRAPEGRVVLTVEDNGPGIEPEFLPHVFEMFRQADASSSRPHGGMGIGLALVRQLIELHGGTVSVTSKPDQGAKFTLELPAARDTQKQLSEASGALVPGALFQLRILVVDDSSDTVEMLCKLFEMEGAAVVTASGALEALEIARDRDFDVILSDISMPRMDGFEFVRRLREIEKQQAVPVIALTGFGRAEDRDRARAEGFFSHVTKPIDVNSLVETLSKLPTRGQPARVQG
jgi:two-component system CheB/CheR fusion protein